MPIYAKLSAKPLQAVNAHVLKQAVWRVNALAQTPANYVLELLQSDSA